MEVVSADINLQILYGPWLTHGISVIKIYYTNLIQISVVSKTKRLTVVSC